MATFNLYFVAGKAHRWVMCPELVRTEYLPNSASTTITSFRGKSVSSYNRSAGTFQWTSAVQGLALLMLKHSLVRFSSRCEPATIVGNSGSLAASLDYAISKTPIWLAEMFGEEELSVSFTKRLFERQNPERKMPGPVSISVRDYLLTPRDIRVFLGNSELTDPADLICLYTQLCNLDRPERQPSAKPTAVSSEALNHFANQPQPDDSWLVEAFSRASHKSLLDLNIFTTSGIRSIVKRLSDTSGSFTAKDLALFNRCLTLPHSTKERLGLGEYSAKSPLKQLLKKPLTVAIPNGMPGSTEIFFYLKNVRNYPIEIDYNYAHAIEIRRAIEKKSFFNPPELTVLGIAPAITLMRSWLKHDYLPLMFLPSFSHQRIFKGRKNSVSKARQMMFLDSEPSTSRLYFEDLCRLGLLNKNRCQLSHGDPGDIFSTFAESPEDLDAIVYFPHCLLNQQFNGCQTEDSVASATSQKSLGMKEAILFGHRSLIDSEQCHSLLCGAIRDAWQELASNSALRKGVIASYLADTDFRTSLGRISGATEISNTSYSNS